MGHVFRENVSHPETSQIPGGAGAEGVRPNEELNDVVDSAETATLIFGLVIFVTVFAPRHSKSPRILDSFCSSFTILNAHAFYLQVD